MPAMRINHLVLTGLLLAASVPLARATAGCNAVGWDDALNDNQGCGLYYPAIRWMEDEGMVEGYADPLNPGQRRFLPFNPVNRAEFTKMALLAAGLQPKPCATSPFPDVPKTAWFAPYVCAAKDAGIIGGFPDGTFKPALEINYANASKILAKTFEVDVDPDDQTFSAEQPPIWFRQYTEALRKKNVTAPTIAAFDASVNRGEMAEMLYRLQAGKTSLDDPGDEELTGLGLGYLPYPLEDALGISVSPPDPPYVFAPHKLDLQRVIGRPGTLPGFAFIHALPYERCSESGLWEHCKPLLRDWQIGLYESAGDNAPAKLIPALKRRWGEPIERYFGGIKTPCFRAGVEGEYIETCVIDHPTREGTVVVREWIDASMAYMDVPGITPIQTSDAWYARIRQSMGVVSY
jgi:hypothetical protein